MKNDYRCVTFTGGFWKRKEELVRDVTTGAVYDRFAETGRIAAFRCDWKPGQPMQPHYFWDSDVAKWMEGAAYILAREKRPDLEEKIESLIDDIERNQDENGYFNIYFTVVEPEKRFMNRDCHELYCAGHLLEAAVAYAEATGRERFLRIMERYIDAIDRAFVTEKTANFETPGHEEIELALFRAYRATGKRKFCDLAVHFLERRGQPDNAEAMIFSAPGYAQSHAPIREQHEAVGHAVRAGYLYAAMADYAAETGDSVLLQTCRDLFDDITRKKMYVTGGVGSTRIGEAYTVAYDLPNGQAYTETCASLALIFFADRLFRADPAHPSKYADLVELELYNGALSGLSLDGEQFFYENPLEIYEAERHRITATRDAEPFPPAQRVKVFGCSCCPPNLTRVYSSLGTYFYSYDETENAVYIHQFGSSVLEMDGVHVTQETDYPHTGRVHITADVPVYVRIPGWCAGCRTAQTFRMVNGYARFDAGEITLDFAMQAELVGASPRVVRNIGKAVLRRGPVIYCAEGVDHDGDVHTLAFDRRTVHAAQAEYSEDIGLDVLRLDGFRLCPPPSGDLYAPYAETCVPVQLNMIPYHAFANRGETDMLVYLPVL